MIKPLFARRARRAQPLALGLSVEPLLSTFIFKVCETVARRFQSESTLTVMGLMCAGYAIGCFMLRQMEYDADSYEIRLAGSEAFEATTRKMHLLGYSLELAYRNMRTSWKQSPLVSNQPGILLL